MKESEIIEASLVQVPQTQLVQASPAQMLEAATEQANVLAAFIEKKKLYANISGKKYVMVEGWVPLARMNGVIPREVSNDKQENGSYVARVQLVRISDGIVLTEASGSCGEDDDKVWKDRPDHAKRSMATTRATGKACRLAYSWIMSLAGYEPTPKEEMPDNPYPSYNQTKEIKELDRDFKGIVDSGKSSTFKDPTDKEDQEDLPYWTSEGSKGTRFINVKVGSHFNEAFLKDLGFQKGAKGTTWWAFFHPDVERKLVEYGSQETLPLEGEVKKKEVDEVRQAFRKTGMTSGDIESVMRDILGNTWKEPHKWTRAGYGELCTFLGKNLIGS